MAQRAFIGAADGVSISTASAVYYAPLGCGPAPGTILVTTEANVEHIHRGADVVLKRMYTRVQTNARSTASTVTIRKNGAGTALATTIGSAVTGTLSNLSDTVTLTAGDRYCVEVALGTGTGNLLIVGITLAMEAASQCIFPITASGSQSLINANVTRYQALSGPLPGVQTTESIIQLKSLIAGALSNLQVYATANGSTNATTAKSRLNAADGSQTLSVASGVTGKSEDTTNSDTIAIGDLMGHAFVSGAGTASFTHSFIGYTFTPSTARQSQLTSRNATTVLAASTTRYAQILGRCAFNSTEGNVQIAVPFACRLSALTAKTSVNASTTTVTCQLRINGATVNNTTTIAGGATGFSTAATQDDIAQPGDLIDVIVSGADGSVTFQGFSILVEELQSYSLTADAGAFTETGKSAGFVRTFAVVGDVGSFSLTGQDAALRAPAGLSAAVGAFSMTGGAAGFLRGLSVTAAAGAFTATGQAANFLYSRVMPSSVGAFVLTGQAAALVKPGAYAVIASAGAYVLTGGASFAQRSSPSDAASFLMEGQSANLARTRIALASAGSFVFTGGEAQFSVFAPRRAVFILG